MFSRLGNFVSHSWWLVIAGWAVTVLGITSVAPRWDDVTYDGDFAFLPREMPSVVGQRLTREAFPQERSKSEIVLVVARPGGKLQPADLRASDDLAKRFYNFLGAVELRRARGLAAQAARRQLGAEDPRKEAAAIEVEDVLLTALQAFDEALRLDDRFAAALHNRALVQQELGHREQVDDDRRAAWEIDPTLRHAADQIVPPQSAELPLVDVWTRHTEVFGEKLRSPDQSALLVILRLSNEFMATDNMRVMDMVERQVAEVRRGLQRAGLDGLVIEISGSAAVGGDMLRAAAESIKNTEMFTIALVVVILLIVYRAPLLVMVPLITIAASLFLSTALLALLTQLHTVWGLEWFDFKIFKTTKIFIIVILFGAGTDFCLFLISRYREELAGGWDHARAVSRALAGVGDALAASALTTILGLGMMAFADFGKFRYSGPAIGICLAVTLLACVTLAPALLRALGKAVFWPFQPGPYRRAPAPRLSTTFWEKLARLIVAYPGRILVFCVFLLSPLAVYGFCYGNRVTFDFLSELAPDRASIRGSELLKRHFPVGEGGPVVVLARKADAGFDHENREIASLALTAIRELTEELRRVEGVHSVRSLYEPLGDPPQRVSVTATRKIFMREHRLTKSIFLAQRPPYRGNVTRLELVLEHDPFSLAATRTMSRIDQRLQHISADESSFWHAARFTYTGTTAGIRDLRQVTRSDNRRIQLLVVLAVFAVLLVILRRPLICLYLIVSVLFSYLVTIGAAQLFFSWAYGASFEGLDWKVPVFLFVILVAVGEDYNIYLVTRVFEEQQRYGPFAGLRAAIVRTGGIITSCGLIMAGTFISMTSGTLRGMVELGFALSLGIFLDTFIVRTIVVPAFLSLVCRWQAARAP